MEFVKEIDGKKVRAVQAKNGKLYLIWDKSPANKRWATYDLSPCIWCGDVRRYVSNNHCPTCYNEINKDKYQ